MPANPIAREALDAYGLDALCEDIYNRTSMTAIAEKVGVSLGSLINWIGDDSERSARVLSVRRNMGKIWDEQAEAEIRGATDEIEMRKAKELAHHFRWRSSKIDPAYADKVEHAHSGKVTLESLVTGVGQPE